MDISLSFFYPLELPLYNNPEDNAVCQSRLHKLTTALQERQLTTIGLTQTLTKKVAQQTNRFSINHCDYAIAQYMEDTLIEEDEDTNPQLTEKFLIKSEYIFLIDSMNKKYENTISTALTDTRAYDSYFNKF